MTESHAHKIVSQEEAGIRLDRCLRLWIPQLPQSLIEKAARKGHLKVEGVKAKPSLRVETGQSISFPKSFLTLENEVLQKQPLLLTKAEKKWLNDLILYQNEDIVVLNKPAGIAVQGGTKQTKPLDALLKIFDESATPRLVHRIDQDTSGILVFARTLPMSPIKKKALFPCPFLKSQIRFGRKFKLIPKTGSRPQPIIA
jgi:23S rRNA pseudouridine955/2504/2580 synthase